MRPMLLRARINAKRNSAGMSSGNSAGVSDSSGPSVGVSGVGSDSGAGAAAVAENRDIFILGIGIEINGFFVRIIKVVVAT